MVFKILRRIAVLAGVLVFSATAAIAQTQTVAAPQAMVKSLNDSLLYMMKNAEALRFSGRRDFLAARLDAVFHLPVMARIVVGSRWRKLNQNQQQRLVDGFSRLTVSTYASRFDGWSGESFEIRAVKPMRDKTVLVKTAILRPKADTVEINYLMHQFKSGWRVIDVYLKQSYSELATKRSEYSSVLRRRGFEALIRKIEQKVAQYAAAG